MDIQWTATIDGEPEPRLDAMIRIGPFDFESQDAFLRALEHEMHYLFTMDLPNAVISVVKDRWV